MKKYLFIIMFVTAAMSANAQSKVGTWSVIPRLGVSLSNLTDHKLIVSDAGDKEDSKFKAGMVAGAEIEYRFADMLSASAGVFYSMQGSRYQDCEVSSGDKYYGYRQYRTNLQYINIPLMLNCYVVDGLAVKIGAQLGALVDARDKYKSVEITKNQDLSNTYGERTDVKNKLNDDCNKVDFSIPIGLSYEYMNVILDARYNWGLTNIYKIDGVKSKNRFATVTIGYRFEL